MNILGILLFLTFIVVVGVLSVVQSRVASRLGRQMSKPIEREKVAHLKSDLEAEDVIYSSTLLTNAIPRFALHIYRTDTVPPASSAAQCLVDHASSQYRRIFWSIHSINLVALAVYPFLLAAGSRMPHSLMVDWIIFAIPTFVVLIYYAKIRNTATQALAMILCIFWVGYLMFILGYALLVVLFSVDSISSEDAAIQLAATAFGLLLVYYCLWKWLSRRQLRMLLQRKPQCLLYLWVFGTGSIDSMTNYLGASWRSIGPVWYIRGKGHMVDDTVKVFFQWIRGANIIVTTQTELDSELLRFNTIPHPGGSYRQDSLICNDAIWQLALNRLLRRSDAVVMNLCGFGPANRGCAYELNVLINRIPTQRFIIVVNDSTDIDYLQNLLREQWEAMAVTSPNRRPESAPINLFLISEPLRSNDEAHMLRSSKDAAQVFKLLLEGMACDRLPGHERVKFPLR